MNITDIQQCADFYQTNFIETFYFIITYSGKSFILIGEKENFPHLMGIRKNVYRSNGYRNPRTLYNDILSRNPINTNIIPNNIATTSKMYTKVLNFQNSTDIFWKNSGPLAINFNPALSHTHLDNVDVLLTDINAGYIISTSGCSSSSAIPISNAPMDFNAPTEPPYPRASSAILPFCLKWAFFPCFSTGTPNMADADAQ